MARKQHPKRGKVVGSGVCTKTLPGKQPCGAPISMVVAATGAIYYNCNACAGKVFFGLAESEEFLIEQEAKKAALDAQVKPTSAATSDEPKNEPVKEAKRERSTDDMWA